jgi:serine protease AprX
MAFDSSSPSPYPLGVRPVLPLPVRMNADVSVRGAGVGIAMVDSDFVVHPDISGRIAAYYDAVADRTYDCPPDVPVLARHWHGTMTACTAAGDGALSQGEFSSLAPESTVVLIRTMHADGRIPTATIVRALRWLESHAEEYGIRVVNLSVYADELDQSLNHPVTAAVESLVETGIVVVAAAGNNPWVPIRPPASSPAAITVGGLDDKNTLQPDDSELYHSTFGITELGIQKPDLIAPAIWLPAPILPGTPTHREAAALCALDAMDDAMLVDCAPRLIPRTSLPLTLATSRDVALLRSRIAERLSSQLIASSYYKMVDGTSFAAPIVASVVAQILSMAPSLDPTAVKSVLCTTAVQLPDHPLLRQGSGVLRQRDALAATRRALNTAAA